MPNYLRIITIRSRDLELDDTTAGSGERLLPVSAVRCVSLGRLGREN